MIEFKFITSTPVHNNIGILPFIYRTCINQVNMQENTFNRGLFHKIPSYLQFNEQWKLATSSGEPLLSFWREKHNYSSITPSDINQWQSLIKQANLSSEQQEIEVVYLLKTYAEKYPTSENYCKYFDKIENSDHNAILKALEECGTDYLGSQLIWNKFLEHNDFEDLPSALLDMFKVRLRTPHREIRNTYETFSKWVSSTFPETYTSIMRDASKILNETQRKMRYIEKLESNIRKNPDNPLTWIDYISRIAKFANFEQRENQPIINFKTVKQIFLRSLFYRKDRIANPLWFPVWNAYIRAFERYQAATLRDYIEALSEIIRTYPENLQAYRPILRNLGSEIELVRTLEVMEPYMLEYDAEGFWLIVVQDILGACNRVSNLQLLVSLLRKYGEIAANSKIDNDHGLFKTIINVLESLDNEEAIQIAKGLIVEFFESFAMETESWLFCFQFFIRRLPKHVKKLLTLWSVDVLDVDDPKTFLHEMLSYIRVNGTRDDYIHALNTADELREHLERGEAQEEMDEEETEETNGSHNKKAKIQQTKDELTTRSREQFRIRLSPLAEGVTEQDIRSFFEGYGEPVSVQVINSDPSMAIVELNSEREVLTCLTRDIKPLKGEPVKVSRLFANTLWITNYPPEYSFEKIKDLVNSFGKIAIDIRLPSQADLKQRRFCYADFSDPESAQHVRNELNGLVVNNYEVQAEISNPTLKKDRKAPPISRQVYVHNLNFRETTEATLRQFFLKFGDVEGIKLPLSEANKSKGNISNGFAFITFTTEIAAKEAVALGGAQLDGRRIEIAVVKTKQNLQNANVSHFKADSTVSIQNVNAVVTSDQLKAFLEEKVGPVAKILLQPSRNAALVEFETFKDAGKVGLLLEGVEYQDHILHVGLKGDFVKGDLVKKEIVKDELVESSAGATTTPKMVPPMLMRRHKRK